MLKTFEVLVNHRASPKADKAEKNPLVEPPAKEWEKKRKSELESSTSRQRRCYNSA
jgi:hypothetical protein